MEAHNIRIGNTLLRHGKPIRVSLTVIETIALKESSHHFSYFREYNPMPITDDWMLSVGFVKNTERSSGNITCFELPGKMGLFYVAKKPMTVQPIDGYYLAFPDFLGEDKYGGFYSPNLHNPMKFVHEMENMILWITGKELEVKQA